MKVSPNKGGSRVEMIWIREFKRNARGRVFRVAFRLLGNRIFDKYANEIVENLENVEAEANAR
jgi:hypothetical protein